MNGFEDDLERIKSKADYLAQVTLEAPDVEIVAVFRNADTGKMRLLATDSTTLERANWMLDCAKMKLMEPE